MAGTRKDIASLGTWSDEMIWYALAVAELRNRTFDNRTSWTFLGAIHGINPQGWVNQQLIDPNGPLPTQADFNNFFNQCQHAGWFSSDQVPKPRVTSKVPVAVDPAGALPFTFSDRSNVSARTQASRICAPPI